MKRVAGLLGLLMASVISYAQIHVSTLRIKANQKYTFEQTDIVVADTLIMEDSATIVLNPLKRENYLHTKVMIIGKHCVIQGSGVNGKQGRAGRAGNSPVGPCKNATNGTAGGRGLDGTPGVNLFLYLDKITMEEPLIIDLHGGDGGEGGKGGNGGSGTSGTVHCKGGDGGVGGDAGNGANGGNGGSLTIHCPAAQEEFLGRNLKIRNFGGRYGKGGRGGYPGGAGLGPQRNGKPGMPGAEGLDGGLGRNGTISIVGN
jgi:hypothetical protein